MVIELAVVFLLAFQNTPSAENEGSLAWAPDALAIDLHFFSSDAFQGRKTGEFGGLAAGRWLQTQYQRLGFEPLGGQWLHPFPASPLRLTRETGIKIGEQYFSAGGDFIPHPSTPAGEAVGEVIFVGYGMQIPEISWNDFSNVDLTNKIALLLRWEPQADDPDSVLHGRRLLPQSRLAAKVKACHRRGAIAVLVADAPGPSVGTEAAGKPFWPEHSEIYKRVLPGLGEMMPKETLAKTNFTEADIQAQLFGMMQGSGPLGAKIPVAYLSGRMARALIRKSGRDLEEWIKQTDETLASDSFSCGVPAEIKVNFIPASRVGRNLVGYLAGTNPELGNELVLVTAHYDHVGNNPTDGVWNGADDNGSGTIGLLALAKHFSKPQNRTERPLVFCAFDGEELGLLGANRFLGQGVVEQSKIVALLNIDMIGRAKNHTVSVVGSKSAVGLREIAEISAQGLALTLDFNAEEFFDRSDQAPFYFDGIPILFLNTAEHPDYHTPQDDADKILYQDMSQICLFAYRIVKKLGNGDRLEFVDGYGRRREVYGQPPDSLVPWPIPFHQRMEY